LTCSRCTVSTSFIAAADRRCAFPDGGAFVGPSLHCGTIGALGALAGPVQKTGDGQGAAIVPGPREYVVLVWRKEGSVLAAPVVSDLGTRVLTLALADAVISLPRRP
jgi:hypothetical protein